MRSSRSCWPGTIRSMAVSAWGRNSRRTRPCSTCSTVSALKNIRASRKPAAAPWTPCAAAACTTTCRAASSATASTANGPSPISKRCSTTRPWPCGSTRSHSGCWAMKHAKKWPWALGAAWKRLLKWTACSPPPSTPIPGITRGRPTSGVPRRSAQRSRPRNTGASRLRTASRRTAISRAPST